MSDGKVIYSIEGDNSGFQSDIRETENIASKGYSGIKKAGTVAFTAIGAAAVAGGVAVAGMITKSIQGFAEFEQLVGGVETLFKDSSDTVQQYADDAFKTAGLSANEYMSTVTSFSASLLQSLGGDTEKAAQYADMAVTDMSDNANKMGTDMELIQNAYQGFAKQNYTMLDNLKLGYGGTKEEMQRLLDKANELNAQQGIYTDYQIDSYADIVDAIHVVQDEMGITGTTALEASETIQGSFSALGSAWENLLVGFSDPDADIDVLMGNVVDSLITFSDNLMPVIIDMLPKLTAGIAELLGALIPLLPPMMAELIPAIIEGGLQIVDGVLAVLPELLTTVIDALLSNIPLIVETGITLFIALIEAMPEIITQIVAALPEIIAQIVDTLLAHIPELVAAGLQLFVALVTALPEILVALNGAVLEILKSLVKGFLGGVKDMVSVGKDLLQGLIDGIKAKVTDAVKAVREAVGNVVDGAKKFLGIKSPSKVFEVIGRYTDEGLAAGIIGAQDLPLKAVRKLTAGIEMAAIPQIDTSGVGFAPMTGQLFTAGDNHNEPELLAPESTVRKIIQEEMSGLAEAIGQQSVTVRASGSAGQLIRYLKFEVEKEERRRGSSLVKGKV